MISLKQVQEIALGNVVQANYLYLQRKMCRWFSTTYHTPLSEVEAMPFFKVALTFYETQYDKMDEDERLEDMALAVNPNFEAEEEGEVQDFISRIEEEEENKRNKGKIEKIQQAAPEAQKAVVRTFQDDTPEDSGLEDEE